MSKGARQTALRLAIAALACLSLYLPHWGHFAVTWPPLGAAAGNAGAPLAQPAVLTEIAQMSFGIELQQAHADPMPVARQLLQGQLPAPEYLPAPMPLKGYPHDYLVGPPTLRLFVAGMGVETVLLRAYERSKDPALLQAALQRSLQLAAVERSTWVSTDFLWNDHAIAARIAVLARLLLALQGTALDTADTRQAIGQFAMRSGRLLADPGHFTVRTNHGVMQNVALLQIALIYPDAGYSRDWRDLALQRLRLQLGFFVSPEGVVLEHSAEYHLLGVELLSMAARLLHLNGLNPPQELTAALAQSPAFTQAILRPDGSLPLIGNTSTRRVSALLSGAADGSQPLRWAPIVGRPSDDASFPVSGYAVWNDTQAEVPSQLVVAWANHPGHGHKHADELSVSLWADGVDWLSAVGYWPYGWSGLDAAVGWRGSNAPHAVGEAFAAGRSTRVLGRVSAPGFRLLDLERQGTSGQRFRRQVLWLDASRLVVVDDIDHAAGPSEVLWTSAAGAGLRSLGDDRFAANGGGAAGQMLMACASSAAARPSGLTGSLQPFGGWVVKDGAPRATEAVLWTLPAGRTSLACAFDIGKRPQLDRLQFSQPAAGAAPSWRLQWQGVDGPRRLERQGDIVQWQFPAGSASYRITVPAQDLAAVATLRQGFSAAVTAFPPWRDISYYRLKAMALLAVLVLGCELTVAALVRLSGALRLQKAWQAAALLLWPALAAGLHWFYLSR